MRCELSASHMDILVLERLQKQHLTNENDRGQFRVYKTIFDGQTNSFISAITINTHTHTRAYLHYILFDEYVCVWVCAYLFNAFI